MVEERKREAYRWRKAKGVFLGRALWVKVLETKTFPDFI